MNFKYTKGSKEDFKNAPEEALVKIRHDGGSEIFAEKFEYGANYWYGGQTTETDHLKGYYTNGKVIAERVVIPCEDEVEIEWDDRGLPPVGFSCEVYFSDDSSPVWKDITLKYIGDRVVVAKIGNKEFTYTKNEITRSEIFFRKKALTAEQIRENVIEEINTLVGDIEAYPTWRDAIAAIYDAGYRKIDYVLSV